MAVISLIRIKISKRIILVIYKINSVPVFNIIFSLTKDFFNVKMRL